MGLDINYFYSLTPRQFYNIQNGWATRRDAESKERIILTRKLMYSSLAPYSKNLTEQKLWPLDFDAVVDDAEVDLKEIEAIAERWALRDAKEHRSTKKLTALDLLQKKATN